jgi:hypothetical protein
MPEEAKNTKLLDLTTTGVSKIMGVSVTSGYTPAGTDTPHHQTELAETLESLEQ